MYGTFFSVDSNLATTSLTYGGQMFSDLLPLLNPFIYVSIAGLAIFIIIKALSR